MVLELVALTDIAQAGGMSRSAAFKLYRDRTLVPTAVVRKPERSRPLFAVDDVEAQLPEHTFDWAFLDERRGHAALSTVPAGDAETAV